MTPLMKLAVAGFRPPVSSESVALWLNVVAVLPVVAFMATALTVNDFPVATGVGDTVPLMLMDGDTMAAAPWADSSAKTAASIASSGRTRDTRRPGIRH